MSTALTPLQSRTLSSGLAERTLRNLEFIKNSDDPNVHPVTQVVNSLLALLVFPVERERRFLEALPQVTFSDPSDFSAVAALVRQHLLLPSLEVAKFHNCKNLRRFFKRLRNATSHKNLCFSGDADSKVLADVKITFKDKPRDATVFEWEVTMTAADVEVLSRYVARIVIDLGL